MTHTQSLAIGTDSTMTGWLEQLAADARELRARPMVTDDDELSDTERAYYGNRPLVALTVYIDSLAHINDCVCMDCRMDAWQREEDALDAEESYALMAQ